MEATTKDLRLHTKSLMAATSRGEEVVISYRGKKRAKLVPLEEDTPHQGKTNPLFGLWADDGPAIDVDEQVRQLRQPRSFDGAD